MSDTFQDQSWAFPNHFGQALGTEVRMEDLGNSLIGPFSFGSGQEMRISPAEFRVEAAMKMTPLGRHLCPHELCLKHYARKGDLARHIENAHQDASAYHCHIELCPRSIIGNGFPRKDKLVAHLMSKKHGLAAAQANYEATFYNLKH